MHSADLMGLDMRKYNENSLFFIHLKGRNFKKKIEEQLPQLVKARADYNIKTRVVIDPMTPVIWATAEKLEQRELIGKLLDRKSTRLNSSHSQISYAVFCLKKKKKKC